MLHGEDLHHSLHVCAKTWLTIKIDCLDEADVVPMRAVEAEQICWNVLIVEDLQHHPHMHLVPLDILDRPCTGRVLHPVRTLSSCSLICGVRLPFSKACLPSPQAQSRNQHCLPQVAVAAEDLCQ